MPSFYEVGLGHNRLVGLAEYLSSLAEHPIDKGQRFASLCEFFQDETPELTGGTVVAA